MGRCFRCKTEYSSGSFIGGHEYCTMCHVRLMQEEDAKKKRGEEIRRRREETLRAASSKTYLRRREVEKRELRDQSTGRATVHPRAKPKPHHRAHGHLRDAAHISPAAHVHSPAHGIHWSPERAGASKQTASKPLRKGVGQKSASRPSYGFFASSGASKSKLSLEALSLLPEKLSHGQAVNLLLKGLSLNTKPVSVTLEAWATDSLGKKITVETEPERCTLEAVGEGQFSLSFSIPHDAALGKFRLSARLHENAYHIDPALGKSEVLELYSSIG